MKNLWSKVFIALIYTFLYIPIVILMVNSFNRDRYGLSWEGFSLKWYTQLFHHDTLIQSATHSFTIAFLSATFSTVIGFLIAVALYRYRFYGKQAVNGMLFVLMMSPDIVMAVSLLTLFLLINLAIGFYSLLIAHITFCLPYVVATVLARLKGFDKKMLEAAQDLGASETVILRKIIIPLTLPAIVSGWLLSFTISLDDVVISSFLSSVGYEVLPLTIFSMVKTGISPEINALATLMILLSLSLVILSQLILKRQKVL